MRNCTQTHTIKGREKELTEKSAMAPERRVDGSDDRYGMAKTTEEGNSSPEYSRRGSGCRVAPWSLPEGAWPAKGRAVAAHG